MYLSWDSSAVVLNSDAVVDVESDFDVCALSSEGFVHRIIDDLKDEMVEPPLCGIANVHSRPLAYCFESFKDFNLARSVILLEHALLKNRFIKLLFSFCDLLSEPIIYNLLSKQDFMNNINLKRFFKTKKSS